MVNNNMSDCECTKNNSEVCTAKNKSCIDNSKYDNHGCNNTNGEFWCESSKKCNQANEICIKNDNNLDDIIHSILFNLPDSQIDALKKDICSKEMNDLKKHIIDKHGCNVSKKQYYCHHTNRCLEEKENCVPVKNFDCNGCLLGEEKFCKPLEKCIKSNQECPDADIKDLYGCNISKGEQYCNYTKKCEKKENCIKPTDIPQATVTPTSLPSQSISNQSLPMYCTQSSDCLDNDLCQHINTGACYDTKSQDCSTHQCKCIPAEHAICINNSMNSADIHSATPVAISKATSVAPVATPVATSEATSVAPVATPVATPAPTSCPTNRVKTTDQETKKPGDNALYAIPICSSLLLLILLLILLVAVYHFKVFCI